MEKIVILGGGESGYGAALLAQCKGLDVFISDFGSLKPDYRQLIIQAGISYEEGGHTLSRILDATTIVKSPGIPETAAVVKAARAQGIDVVSEIEFACRYTTARKVCITGSNGKTTTTSLIYQIMKAAGMDVAAVGNIGESFAHRLAVEAAAAASTTTIESSSCSNSATIGPSSNSAKWYVIELSSFQLDGMYKAKAEVAVLLNITPDHLDRYEYKIENYAASKMRITQNQTPSDTFVYNADDAISVQTIASCFGSQAVAIPFSLKGELAGAYFDGTDLVFDDFRIAACELKIKGLHNIANALAAIVATRKIGVPAAVVADVLRSFSGVEHRLEVVELVGNSSNCTGHSAHYGIEYINDSKATNVDSTWYALQSMTKPTVWIAGGTDKGNDYQALVPLAKEHVKALICMGIDNNKLIKAFEGVVPILESTHSLEEAMDAVARIAASGDCVLLSPACASFDLFNNYEDRGRQFKKAVMTYEKI